MDELTSGESSPSPEAMQEPMTSPEEGGAIAHGEDTEQVEDEAGIPSRYDQDPAWRRIYEKRREAEAKAQQLESRLSKYERTIAQLEAQGYDSDDAINAALEAQQHQLALSEYAAQLEDSGADEALQAQLLQERQRSLQVESQHRYLQGQVTNIAIREARQALPDMTPEVESFLRQVGDPEQIGHLTQVLSSYAKARDQRVISQYTAQKGRDRSQPVPEGAGGGDAPFVRVDAYKPTGRISSVIERLRPPDRA